MVLQKNQFLYHDPDSGCMVTLVEQPDGSYCIASATHELLDRHLLGRAQELARDAKAQEPSLLALIDLHFAQDDVWDGFWPEPSAPSQ